MEEPTLIRLDKALALRGLVSSRARGAALVDEGGVFVNGVVTTDRDRAIRDTDVITLSAETLSWVARSALKLIHALDHWQIDPTGLVVLDIGASTGGFTEVLLSRGAKRVYALDVGHDQLAPTVKADPRVENREGVHIKDAVLSDFDPKPELIVVDVSFISLTKILSKVKELSPVGGQTVLLVKPQFEVGRGAPGKGVVKDSRLHQEAIEGVKNFALALGFTVDGPIPSPILGGDGNKEFLLRLTRRK